MRWLATNFLWTMSKAEGMILVLFAAVVAGLAIHYALYGIFYLAVPLALSTFSTLLFVVARCGDFPGTTQTWTLGDPGREVKVSYKWFGRYVVTERSGIRVMHEMSPGEFPSPGGAVSYALKHEETIKNA